MTDDWDFFALRVDGEPASIFVDLGVQSAAPVHSLPIMAYIRLHMKYPRPDGLSSREEFDALVEVENDITGTLCGNDVAYIGRNTSSGCRDFYFYISEANDWQTRVDRVMSEYQDYTYDTGTREDATWSVYFNFLLPGPVDRHRIANRRVCEALERHGDPLTAQREIHHWSYFPTKEAADAYIDLVEVDGFQLQSRPMGEKGPLRFGVQVWRLDLPSYENIDRITLPLFEAAQRQGGKYDGWESPIEA